MYKNPLNNGDISDYNSLKKQRNYGNRIKKYQKKLPIQPTELQKYYQYMTYQQPILDELNYVSERIRSENINKQKDDFNFIENLKIEREKNMKEQGRKENDIRNDLFDYQSTIKQDDLTPSINTDVEMEYEIRDKIINIDLFDNLENTNVNLFQIKDKEPTDFFELTKNKQLFTNIIENLPIGDDFKKNKKISNSVLSQADTEQEQEQKQKNKKNAGRPKGSKNYPKRTLLIK